MSKERKQDNTFETLEQKRSENKETTQLQNIRDALAEKTIFITPYAHCDWCWSHSRNWAYIRYATSLNEILDLMRENPDFTWYADSWITHILPFLKAYPERIQEFAEAVRRGQMAICGDYSNVRINMVAEEALVRNIIYGKRDISDWFPEAELSVNGAYVDVALGGPQTPQIMKKGGYEFYRAQRPFQILLGKNIPHDFIWRGLDGSEILCWWGPYGGWWTKELAELDFRRDWEGAVQWMWKNDISTVADLNSTDVLITSHGSDDSRPLRSHNGDMYIDLPGIIDMWNKNETSTLRFGTPVSAFHMMQNQRDRMKVVEGTIDPCDVAYNCAYCGEKGLLQTRIGGAEALVRAEKWMTLASQLCGFAYQSLEDEWRENLKISAHASQDIFVWDYDEFKRWGEQAISSAVTKMDRAIDTIASCLDVPENAIGLLFNPHDKSIRRSVYLTVVADHFDTLKLFDGLGNPVPYQIEKPLYYNDIWECRLRCIVTLPPMGYTCITAEGAELKARFADPDILGKVAPTLDQPLSDTFTVDNGAYLFAFDHGNLVSIQRKADGVYMQEPDSTPWNHVEYRHCDSKRGVLLNGPVCDTHPVQWDSWKMKLNGPVVWEIELEGTDGTTRYQQILTIEQNSGRVDVETNMYWNYEGFMVASVPMPKYAPVYGGVLFGMEYKDLENEKYDPIEENLPDMDMHRFRKGLFYAKNAAFYRTDTHTVSLSPTKGDRYFIKNNDNGQLEYMLINALDQGPFWGEHGWKELVSSYSMKGTGEHSFHYSFFLYDGEIPAETVLSDAAALRDEITYRRVSGHPGRPVLPAHASLLQINDAAVFVSAFYQEGDDIILRVYDTVGKAARDVQIDLPFKPLRASAQDFIGNADLSKSIQIRDHSIRFEILPFEILTIRMKVRIQNDRIG